MKKLLFIAIALFSAVAGTAALGQTYPANPIKIVSATPAGSSSDVLGRILADELHRETSATFIVENRPAAGACGDARLAACAGRGRHALWLL